MGLQTVELEDIAYEYDSIPIILLTIIAGAIRNLRVTVFNFLHLTDNGTVTSLSELFDSGLSTLIFIADKLNLLNMFAIAACSNSIDDLNGCSDDIDCVVCLCEMRKGERLRKLECGHVFHKKCLEVWLRQLHFTCPLCRSPVPTIANSKSNMESNSSSFRSQLVSWFGIR